MPSSSRKGAASQDAGDESDSEIQVKGETFSPRGAKRVKRAPVVQDDEDDVEEEAAVEENVPEVEGDAEAAAQVAVDYVAPDLERDTDGYVTGSIVRIACKNFLTYEQVEFCPGPDLNMIVGPNGTGKSTIAGAIVIGLGFPTTVLGRAKKVSEFVRTGTDNAWVEIELKGSRGKKNTIVKRTLTLASETTHFFLNGKPSTTKAVREKMAELNLQVNNLCSFLPQDRVAHFSRMSSPEYLKETQKAAGAARLTEWHNTLIAERKTEVELEDVVDMQEQSLKGKVAKNASDLHLVKLLEERREIEKSLAILNLLLPYVQYDSARAEHIVAKEIKNQLTNELKELEHANLPFVESKEGLKGLCRKYEAEQKSLASELKILRHDANETSSRAVKAEKAVESLRDKLVDTKSRAKTRLETIKSLKEKISHYQVQVDNKPEVEDERPLIAESNELTKQLSPLTERSEELLAQGKESEREMIANARALESLHSSLGRYGNVFKQRETALSQYDAGTYKILQWKRANEHHFKGIVLDPIRLIINPTSKEVADLAEGPIPVGAFSAFVCELQEDYEFMVSEVFDKLNMKGQIVQMPPGRTLQYYRDKRNHLLTDQQMREIGFDCWAIDLLTGPDLALAWLCEAHKVGNTPIALSVKRLDTNKLAQTAIQRYYTPEGSVNVKRSTYGSREVVTETRLLEPAKILVTVADTQKIAGLQKEIAALRQTQVQLKDKFSTTAAKQATVETQKRKLIERKSEIQKRRAELAAPLKNWRAACAQLDTKQASLAKEMAKPSEAQKEATLREQMAAGTKKRVEIASKHAKYALDAMNKSFAIASVSLELLQASSDHRAMDSSASEKDQEIADKTKQLEDASKKTSGLYHIAKQLAAVREALTEAADDEVKEAANVRHQNHETVEELEAAKALEEARLENGQEMDPAVIQRYEARKIEIAKLEAKLSEAKANLADSSKTISDIKGKWVPALTALVATIDKKFSASFSGMGLLGEVRVAQDADYDKWGIEILVAFRDTETLQVLNQHRQSGGERALATVMYLMALAEIARGPFALVDEINQGMDQRVERLVHNQLVATTCTDEVGQYFLLTPKLLPALDYHPRMKVLVINNGDWLPDKLILQSVVNNKMKLKTAARRAVAA